MSKLLDAVHEMACDLYKAGAMDEITMRQIDAMCLSPKKAQANGERLAETIDARE